MALVDAPLQPANPLALALREHDEQPDAASAARVLHAIAEAAPVAPETGEQTLDLPALQARLGPADALVVFGQQGEELLACIVRRSRVQVFRRLARWREVRTAWRLARFQLDALSLGCGPPPAQLPKLTRRAQLRLQALHQLVWAPLSDTLADARRLLLVPTAALAGLPFAALQDGLSSLAQQHLLAEVASLRLAQHGLVMPAGPPVVELVDHSAARVQALLASGVSRLLGCRWPVADAVTAALLARFQRELQRGRSAAEALAEAQAGLMVSHPHPAYWAGFVLYGGW